MQYAIILKAVSNNTFHLLVSQSKLAIVEAWTSCQDVNNTRHVTAQLDWPKQPAVFCSTALYEVIGDDFGFHIVGFEPYFTIPTITSVVARLVHAGDAHVIPNDYETRMSYIRGIIKVVCVYGRHGWLSTLRQAITAALGNDDDSVTASEPHRKRPKTTATDVVALNFGVGKWAVLKCPRTCLEMLQCILDTDLHHLAGRFGNQCTPHFETLQFNRRDIMNRFFPEGLCFSIPWIDPKQHGAFLARLQDVSIEKAASVIVTSWLHTQHQAPAVLIFSHFPSKFPRMASDEQRVRTVCRVLSKIKASVSSRYQRYRGCVANADILSVLQVGGQSPVSGVAIFCTNYHRTEYHALFNWYKTTATILHTPEGQHTQEVDATEDYVIQNGHRLTLRQFQHHKKSVVSHHRRQRVVLCGNTIHVGQEMYGMWWMLTEQFNRILPVKQLLKSYTRMPIDGHEADKLLCAHRRTLIVSPQRRFRGQSHVKDLLDADGMACDFLVTDEWDATMMSIALSTIQEECNPTFFCLHHCWS